MPEIRAYFKLEAKQESLEPTAITGSEVMLPSAQPTLAINSGVNSVPASPIIPSSSIYSFFAEEYLILSVTIFYKFLWPYFNAWVNCRRVANNSVKPNSTVFKNVTIFFDCCSTANNGVNKR